MSDLEWSRESVKLRAFGVEVTVSISQSDPMGTTLVDVNKAPEANIAVQLFQDTDLCREF